MMMLSRNVNFSSNLLNLLRCHKWKTYLELILNEMFQGIFPILHQLKRGGYSFSASSSQHSTPYPFNFVARTSG